MPHYSPYARFLICHFNFRRLSLRAHGSREKEKLTKKKEKEKEKKRNNKRNRVSVYKRRLKETRAR